jgi:hypothetical protein
MFFQNIFKLYETSFYSCRTRITLISSQPVFALYHYYCMLSGEATNTNLTVFGLTRWRWKPRIYSTRGEHSNHYTTDGDANPGSTAPEASTLPMTPPIAMDIKELQHQRRTL